MKIHIKYLLIILASGVFLSGCRGIGTGVPPLKETYTYKDKNPFGGYTAYHALYNLYDYVTIADESFSETVILERLKEEDRASVYFIVTDVLYTTESEEDSLISFVKKGNDVFISSNRFSPTFLEKTGVTTNAGQLYSLIQRRRFEQSGVRLFFGEGLPELNYEYFYLPFYHHLNGYDRKNTRVLGTDISYEANFAVLFFGEGRLFLHLAPRALGNYFLLTEHNIDYLFHIADYLEQNPEIVYWDEYFKNRKSTPGSDGKQDDGFSTLGVIMQNPPLQKAFLIAVAAFLIFIIMNARRRQKIIPVQEKTQNASVDFVETVARLYYVNKDNKNIASKRITYFYEYVRTKYFLKSADSSALRKKLTNRKGLDTALVKDLMDCIEETEASEVVSDEQLIRLNRLLENFYNQK